MSLFRRRPPKIDRLRRKGDLEGLRAALSFRDVIFDKRGVPSDLGTGVRLQAVDAISQFYGPQVTGALVDALSDDEPEVRYRAVLGLSNLGAPAAVDELVYGVVEWSIPPYEKAVGAALDTLVELRLEALSEHLAGALLDSGEPLTEERHGQAIDRLVASAPSGPETAAEAVTRSLLQVASSDADDGARARALWILERLAPLAPVALLDALADDGNQQVAARLLGLTGSTRSVDALSTLLNHEDPHLRAVCAASLGQIRDARAVEPLLAATRDSEFEVRRAAGQALDELGTVAVVVGVAGVMRNVVRMELDGAPEGSEGHELDWAERAMTRLLGRGAEAS